MNVQLINSDNQVEEISYNLLMHYMDLDLEVIARKEGMTPQEIVDIYAELHYSKYNELFFVS